MLHRRKNRVDLPLLLGHLSPQLLLSLPVGTKTSQCESCYPGVWPQAHPHIYHKLQELGFSWGDVLVASPQDQGPRWPCGNHHLYGSETPAVGAGLVLCVVPAADTLQRGTVACFPVLEEGMWPHDACHPCNYFIHHHIHVLYIGKCNTC